MTKALTVQEFWQAFQSEDACLGHLMQVRYGLTLDCPKCGKHSKFHRIRKEPTYACQWCGHRIYPMAGTIFHRSHVPLQKWFYAIYLFTTSRHGVPAKELERQLGVSYPTAFRMAHQIRKHMAKVDGDAGLSGHVEADETYVGGRKVHGRAKGTTGRGTVGKTIILGIAERGGDVITRVVPDASTKTLIPHIIENVGPGATVSTDEWHPYKRLAKHGYRHLFVTHAANQWVNGEAHTNTIDGFWSMLKRAIRGTHVHVSGKHLAKYLGEFEFRYNSRHHPEVMFDRLLLSF